MGSPDNTSKPPLSTPPPSRQEIEEAKTDPPPVPEAADSSAVDDLREDTRVKFYVDRLVAQAPETETVVSSLEIREKMIPDKKTVLEPLVQFVLDEKLDLEGMKITRIIYDGERNILLMDVTTPNTGGGYTLMNYMVEGRQDALRQKTGEPTMNSAKKTSSEWTSWDSDDMPEGGGNLADYEQGRWIKRY
ncbi:MAG TPA: hypothetical protein VI588_00605 [Candidatus Gracilibacteria bacterium]|nr:hypothetical protein [Candidatus Gracilibacteria bacterium]